jgi:hypothetical protein
VTLTTIAFHPRYVRATRKALAHALELALEEVESAAAEMEKVAATLPSPRVAASLFNAARECRQASATLASLLPEMLLASAAAVLTELQATICAAADLMRAARAPERSDHAAVEA